LRSKRLLGVVCLGFAAVAGCQTARVEQSVVSQLGGADPDAQMDFLHTLADQPVTSNDDAFHGLLIFLDGSDAAATYEDRLQSLQSRGLIPNDFNAEANEAVSRGTLAVAIVKALNIRGGLLMSLLGPNPRYAVKELQYMDLFPPSSPNQTFSGTEFLGVIGKLEDYQRGGDDNAQIAEAVEQHDQGMQEPAPDAVGRPPEPIQPQNPAQ
jgi:hypothetical protein